MITNQSKNIKTWEELEHIFLQSLRNKKKLNKDNPAYLDYEVYEPIATIWLQCPTCGVEIATRYPNQPPLRCLEKCGTMWEKQDVGISVPVHFTRAVLKSKLKEDKK